MSDENDETTTETEVEETPEGQEPGEGDETEETPSENDESSLDLDSAKKALSKVRKENAATRTKLRDMEAKFADAKTPEEVEAALADLKAANAAEAHALVVENVALKHKLPDDLAAALKGATREELEAHAAVLAKYVPAEAGDDPDLKGGLDPSGDPDGAFDPVKAARQARANRW